MKKPKMVEGPITEAERDRALERLIEREVHDMRIHDYNEAQAILAYERGGR